MKYKPLVSIITPVLNGAKYIEETILSVVNQTYSNIEYIIIDGGSTDGTLDIVYKYQHKIEIVISEPDEGIYYAMNKGILLCSGELIGIINSDDFYSINTVQIIVNKYLSARGVGVFYGDMVVVDSESHKESYVVSDHKKVLKRLSMWVPHPTVFIPKVIYNKYGVYDRRIKISADFHLIVKLLVRDVSFYKIDAVLAYFRTGGVTYNNSLDKHRSLIKERLSLRKKYNINVFLILLRTVIQLGRLIKIHIW